MAESKKYYWLKLHKDFFKRHDIKIIESMPNGKDYVLFYLKLICESVDHCGNLRFNDQIPYNEQMLSTITNTNIDIVRSAITVFTKLEMMEVLDDGTYFMSKVAEMIGNETEWAKKKRDYRLKKSEEDNVLAMSDKRLEIEKEIEIDTEKEIDIYNPPVSKDTVPPKGEKKVRKKFVKPTLEEVEEYCKSRNNNIDPEAFIAHYESNGWKVGKNPMVSWKSAVITWEKNHTGEQTKNNSNFFNDLANMKQDDPTDWGLGF